MISTKTLAILAFTLRSRFRHALGIGPRPMVVGGHPRANSVSTAVRLLRVALGTGGIFLATTIVADTLLMRFAASRAVPTSDGRTYVTQVAYLVAGYIDRHRADGTLVGDSLKKEEEILDRELVASAARRLGDDDPDALGREAAVLRNLYSSNGREKFWTDLPGQGAPSFAWDADRRFKDTPAISILLLGLGLAGMLLSLRVSRSNDAVEHREWSWMATHPISAPDLTKARFVLEAVASPFLWFAWLPIQVVTLRAGGMKLVLAVPVGVTCAIATGLPLLVLGVWITRHRGRLLRWLAAVLGAALGGAAVAIAFGDFPAFLAGALKLVPSAALVLPSGVAALWTTPVLPMWAPVLATVAWGMCSVLIVERLMRRSTLNLFERRLP
jgi:hypothetical protein